MRVFKQVFNSNLVSINGNIFRNKEVLKSIDRNGKILNYGIVFYNQHHNKWYLIDIEKQKIIPTEDIDIDFLGRIEKLDNIDLVRNKTLKSIMNRFIRESKERRDGN